MQDVTTINQASVIIHTGAQLVETWMSTFHSIKVRLRKLSPRSINFNRDHIERYILPKIGDMRGPGAPAGRASAAVRDGLAGKA